MRIAPRPALAFGHLMQPLLAEAALAAVEPGRIDTRPSLWGLTPDDFAVIGCPGKPEHVFGRVQRIWAWDREHPALGADTRAFLLERTQVRLPRIAEQVTSEDGTTRCVLELADGDRVEAVHMPRDVRTPRVTLCISSQVGCAMGCGFCATASMGLRRNLSAGEIVAQVVTLMSTLGPNQGHRVSVVFMGMGEPLQNLNAVERALVVLCHPKGLGIPPSRITVSTAGIVPAIRRLAQAAPRPRLAISLNATTDEARERLMPVARKWTLRDLRAALDAWPFVTQETVTIGYVLLDGINDTDEDADRLAAWAAGLPLNLNLIAYNPHAHADCVGSSEERLQSFAKRLSEAGASVKVRVNRGRDVRAACGQLVVEAG